MRGILPLPDRQCRNFAFRAALGAPISAAKHPFHKAPLASIS